MTNYEFGSVVLVFFPQSGTAARKQRPGIVVLDIGDADLVIAPVTSRPRHQAGDLTAIASSLRSNGKRCMATLRPSRCV